MEKLFDADKQIFKSSVCLNELFLPRTLSNILAIFTRPNRVYAFHPTKCLTDKLLNIQWQEKHLIKL